MRTFVAAAVFGLTVSVAPADDKEDAARKLNGSYQILSLTVGGKPDDRKKDRVSEFSIKDGTLAIAEKGEKPDAARFTVDPTQKPAHIDIMAGRGEKKLPGIYEVTETDRGLELTIAFPKDPEQPRPTDFKGEGKGVTVVKLLRMKGN